jgi:hypothetical protein
MTDRSTHARYSVEDEAAEMLVELREQLAFLRTSIDQLRSDMHLFTGRCGSPPSRRPVLRITSLPKDPTAPDFFRRINAVPQERLDALRQELAQTLSVPGSDNSA